MSLDNTQQSINDVVPKIEGLASQSANINLFFLLQELKKNNYALLRALCTTGLTKQQRL